MRFAYIDSQGQEIPIPSVDALGLRIELGAIGPDTELYDAQSDRWGPARTHDIYNTLARSAETEGFVAPPPPVPQGRSARAPKDETRDEPPPPASGKEPFFDLGAEILEAHEHDQRFPGAGTSPPTTSGADWSEAEVELDFTLVDQSGEAPAAGDDANAEEEATPDGVDGPDPEISVGDLAPDEALEGWPAAGADLQATPGSDLGDDLEIDVPFDAMDFSSVEQTPGLDLEDTASAFDSVAPPAWLEHEGAWSDDSDDAMDFSRTRAAEDARPASQTPRADARSRERRTPRSRPSPPRRMRSPAVSRVFLTAISIVLLATLGRFLWVRFAHRFGGRETVAATDAFPPVTIPEIPAELLPRLRTLGEEALAATVSELGDLRRDFDIPAEPRNDWLAGVYLANASQFGDVRDYWEALSAYVTHVGEVDASIFHQRFQARLEAERVPADTAAILLERADSGFLATRPQRLAAYALMGDLVDAALALHQFLLDNEADISYEPAAGGVSRDPVLEAVPSTPELGNRMWDMVDRITGALDALGTLDRVTTDRLLAVLLDRVNRAGFE